jgi:ribosome maturation factor RimP
MPSKIAEEAEKLIKPYAESIGLKVAEVEYVRKTNGMNLTVFIYKDQGYITINDCEKLHKLIDGPLDALNPTNDKPYILNVSSLGLDRPLKTEKDFERNIDKEITVKLFVPFEGKKIIEGVLCGYEAEGIKLRDEKGNIIGIPLKNAAKITLKINI